MSRTLLAGMLAFSIPLSPGISVAQSDSGVARITRELVPKVEAAAGMRFRRPPVVATRSREQVRAFLDHKIATELPPAELAASQRTYRAFHLIPDTLDMRRLMLDLYSEQVAGFYDPDSSTLFVVRGSDPTMVRLILAHELVHALQDQYTQLNGILKLKRQNDRQMAGQAVMEGQATLASIMTMTQGQLPDDFWSLAREQIRQSQSSMPVFAAAPQMIQEGLLFPYLAGAEFMHSFESLRSAPGEMPFNDRLPASTEQILHISKYSRRELPRTFTIAGSPGDTVIYEDDFGEFDIRVALMSWGVGEPDAIAAASGWNGDHYRVLGAPAGTVIIWATAWDTENDAQEFERALRRGWEGAAGPSGARRWQVDRTNEGGTAVVRLIDAPAAWAGWRRLPAIRLAPAAAH